MRVAYYFLELTLCFILLAVPAGANDSQTRPIRDRRLLESWLQNMVWHHRYSMDEVKQVSGLSHRELQKVLDEFGISESTRPDRPSDRLLLLPYPGGRHPRIGFLEGAIDPQRETKVSVFAPWDDHSYAVLDIPEAIWSNLGLTYLAHTHIDTVWTSKGVTLPQQEWKMEDDGSLVSKRHLPNGIVFGTRVWAREDHVAMEMWLTNGTQYTLSDLRVQNCVMLKSMGGFTQQSNDNKQFINGYAIAKSDDSDRYVITAWDPVHRTWGNQRCPCLHSDPKFSDCDPGETQFLRGWFSFYQGDSVENELTRIDATKWRDRPLRYGTVPVRGHVRDAASNERIASRLYVHGLDSGQWHFAESDMNPSDGSGAAAVIYDKQRGTKPSIEKHTSLSANPFRLRLPPGRYRVEAVRGKEYVPTVQEFQVTDEGVVLALGLNRFANMSRRGWYCGDTHVHRVMEEIPVAMLAEDLNVALPLNYWVRDSRDVPAGSGPVREPTPSYIDDTHVIYPVNTEYEIFSIDGRRHTQGAVFVLNHRHPLNLTAPPVTPIAEEARRQGAILDLDKHSWNWSIMIVPIMKVDLFELANNHHWRAEFGFPKWTVENAPSDWPEIERDEVGFTERGWTEFGMQTYYAFLNCGFRMRVSAGTASGVHPVPLGHSRVYVHTGDDFSYELWINGLNQGQSFVTNGPLMDLRFKDELPGTTFKRAIPEFTVAVTGTVESYRPLKSIEFIRSGRIVRSLNPQQQKTPSGSYRIEVDEKIPISGSGWIAVRCFEDLPDDRVRFAHTNPVFVDVEDHPLIPRRRDVEFFVKRMDEEIIRNRDVLVPAAVAEYRRAKEIYESILRRSR